MTPIASEGERIGVAVIDPPPVDPVPVFVTPEAAAFKVATDGPTDPLNAGEGNVDSETVAARWESVHVQDYGDHITRQLTRSKRLQPWAHSNTGPRSSHQSCHCY